MRNALLGLLAAVVVTGISCNTAWLDSYWREERYVLIAVDSLGQMALASPTFFDRKKGVQGPFTEREFAQLALTMLYPNFTKTFEDLK